jgi:multidrug resistance efflux pump
MSEHQEHNRLQTDTVSDNLSTNTRPIALSDRVRSLRLENPPNARRSRFFGWLPWVLCGLFALLTASFGVKAFVPLDKLAPPKKPAADDAPVAGSGDVVLEQKGYIIPSRTYQVSPKVAGMVQVLKIKKEGDNFKAGDTLAILETVDYQADVDHWEWTLQNAKDRLAQLRIELPQEIHKADYELKQAKSQLIQYRLDWERAEDLYQHKSIGKSEYDQVRATKDAKENEVNKLEHAWLLVKGSKPQRIAALKAEVAQDEADLDKAKWRLSNCTIVAPSDGTILTKNVEEGNLANPVAFQTAVAASICTMADLSKLEVDINIQERDIKHVKEGQPCRIQAEGFPDREPYPGKVLRIMPNADRAKGAIPVRVSVDRLHPGEKPGEFLRPDTGVVVSFLRMDAPKKEKKEEPKPAGHEDNKGEAKPDGN